MNPTPILNSLQISRKISRMAFEIYEDFFEDAELAIAGIEGDGYLIAQGLASRLSEISAIKVTLICIYLNKEDPLFSPLTTDKDIQTISRKPVVIVDDVLNTGRTMVAGIKEFLKVKVPIIKTAVLVDRNHKIFPVAADYVGMSLSTTLQEHVKVISENNVLKEVVLR